MMSQIRFNLFKNSLNTDENESKIPLSKRTAVQTHIKFNSQLDRVGAQNFLGDGEPGDFIVRPSSDGENYLAITVVTKELTLEMEQKPGSYVTNDDGYFLVHCRIDPSNPSDDFITKSNNPIQEIENFIKNMGTNFSKEKKSQYIIVMELNEKRTLAPV